MHASDQLPCGPSLPPTYFPPSSHVNEVVRVIPGLRVFRPLSSLALRSSLTSRNSDHTDLVTQNDVLVTTAIIQLASTCWFAELEDKKGFVPLFDPDKGPNLLMRALPLERGVWKYIVKNSGASLALRSRPDYGQQYKTTHQIADAEVITATHRVVGAHGAVYVRVVGYNGWLFENRKNENGENENTLLPLGFTHLHGAAEIASPSFHSPPFKGGFDIAWLRELAHKTHLKELMYCPESRLICFISEDWPKTDSFRVNVFYVTGTVATCVIKSTSQPTQQLKKKKIFRRCVSASDLFEMMVNPMHDSERGYYTMTELAQRLAFEGSSMNEEFDEFVMSFSEQEEEKRQQRKRKREEERTQREDIAKRRKDHDDNSKRERGLNATSWFLDGVRAKFVELCNLGTLKRLFFLSDTEFIGLNENGTTFWTSLAPGRLYSLLRGRGNGLTTKVKTLALCCGGNYYYVEFMDGKRYWHLPQEIGDLISQHQHVDDIALGYSAQWGVQYIFKSQNTFHWRVEGLPSSWLNDELVFFSLGPNGQFYLLRDDAHRLVSWLPRNQHKDFKRLWDSGKTITEVYFGYGNSLVLRHT